MSEQAIASSMPSASAELASAFDAPVEEAPATEEVEAEAPSPSEATADPEAEAKDALKARLREVRQQIAAAQLAPAAKALDELRSEARRLGGFELQASYELDVKVGLAQKELKRARKAAEAWLSSCGPERIEWCRAKATAALKQVAAQKGADATAAKNLLAAVKVADECLAKAEAAGRAKAAVPACLETAAAKYRSLGDWLQVQRAFLAKAQSAVGDERKKAHAPELAAKAAQACQEPRCVSVRRRAKKLEGWLLLEAGDAQGAARAMLEDMQLVCAGLPAERRRYARTVEVEKVCAAVDAKDGAGACRKIEKQVVGEYVFKDFSAQKASGQGLPPPTVRTVNEHYSVTLQPCLNEEAERLKPPAYETYGVRWVVRNDGRVDQVHMSKEYQEQSPLARCLRQQFVVWRYPRYEGETQHVEQSFTVSARERR